MYGGKVILRGYKDPSTDLWILPITPDKVQQQGKLQTSPGYDYVAHATKAIQSQAGPCMACALQSPMNVDNKPELTEMATFTHYMRTQVNAVKFGHRVIQQYRHSQKLCKEGSSKSAPISIKNWW